MKFTKVLKALLVTQLVMYILFMLILYLTNNADSYSGLLALYPGAIFIILGLVNIILVVIYLVKLARKRLILDRQIPALVVLLIVLTLLYTTIGNLIAPYR